MKHILRQYNHEKINREIVGKILQNAHDKLEENKYIFRDTENNIELDTTGTCEAYVLEYLYQLLARMSGVNNMVINFADGRMWVLS